MLFVPANNWRLIQSAKRGGPDAVILDLEDAVPIGEKETARWFVKDAILLLKEAGQNVTVRVNGLATGLTEEDLKFAIQEGVDSVMLPKSESKEDILELGRLMEKEEKEKELAKISMIPLLETAKGIFNAYEIATASDRVVAISFGAADYMRDFGRSYFTMSPDESELLYARSRLVVAARTARVRAIDTPFLGLIIDKEGLVRESKIASSLGFKGKLCIHPIHIEPINQVFSPSEKDVDSARKIVKEYEEAKARGLGATSVEGRMVDEATYKMAKETLMISDMIAKRKGNPKPSRGKLL